MMCRTTTPLPAARAGNAFTLVELLVVLAIIAIVAGAVSPYARGNLRGRQLQDAALTFAQHVKYAQALAADRGRPTRVWLDLAGQAYRVEVARDFDGQEFEPAAGPGGLTQWLTEGVRFGEVELVAAQGPAGALVFAPTEQWTSGHVPLTNGRSVMLVKISPGLGQVEVLSPAAEQ